MKQKTRFFLIVGLVTLTLLLSSGVSLAQGPGGEPQLADPNPPTPVVLDATSRIETPINSQGTLFNLPTAGTASIIVKLSEPPIAELARDLDNVQFAPVFATQAARVRSSQSSVMNAMTAASIDYELVGAASTVINVLVINADTSQLEAIKALPGVADAWVGRAAETNNSSSVPFLGAPDVWDYGVTGAGVTLAIIDSGVDYNHENFDAPGWPLSHTNKILGGYDFAGDTWDPNTSPTLDPDDDPYDGSVVGHGSHVAGTAAGYGIDSSGNAITSGWNSGMDFSGALIGPGMAPAARFYAFKVGGVGSPQGYVSEPATILALDRAADLDNDPATAGPMVDVVNMSIGGSFGVTVTDDWSEASNNASALGIVVVSSAGNAGDTFFINGDPGVAASVISVAASIENYPGYGDDELGYFSSRGPARAVNGADVALKPDISAPGWAIVSTGTQLAIGGSWVSTDSYTLWGTSMASPHVAGAAALVRDMHPGWSPAQVKAVLMNTATHQVNDGVTTHSPVRAGTGRMDTVAAIDSEMIAYWAAEPEQVNVSFGILNVAAANTYNETITLQNLGSTGCSYTPALYDQTTVTGASFSVPAGTISVPASGTANVNVAFAVDPALMVEPHHSDPTMSETQDGQPRHWLAEATALVEFTDPSCPTLWVALYAAPRPVSSLQSTAATIAAPNVSGMAVISMTGTELDTGGGNYPYDEVSIVSAFELIDFLPNEADVNGFANAGDLEYIGVTSNYPGTGEVLDNTTMYFGFSNYGEWNSLSEEMWWEIYVDPDEDGSAEYLVWNWNYGAALAGSDSSDSFIVVVDDLVNGGSTYFGDLVNGISPATQDTYAFQNRVAFLPVPATAVGLTDNNLDFDFWVAGRTWFDYYLSHLNSYDLGAQAIDLTYGTASSPAWIDNAGPSIPVIYDWTDYEGPEDPCLLLLHHHNNDTTSPRTEIVCLEQPTFYDVGLRKTASLTISDTGEITVVYTITVTNHSATVDAPDVTVDDLLPGDLTYVSHVASVGAYDPVTGVWTIGGLPAGNSVTLTITATVNADAVGTITNVAALFVAGQGVENTPGDNEAGASFSLDTPGSDEGGSSGGSGGGDASTSGEGGQDITTLPSTGYPPQEDSSRSALPYLALVGVALAALTGTLVLRRNRA